MYTLDELKRQEAVLKDILRKTGSRKLNRAKKVVVQDIRRHSRDVLWGRCAGSGPLGHDQTVNFARGAWECSCPDFRDRGHRFGPCKHLAAVAQTFLNGELSLDIADAYEVSAVRVAATWLKRP